MREADGLEFTLGYVFPGWKHPAGGKSWVFDLTEESDGKGFQVGYCWIVECVMCA